MIDNLLDMADKAKDIEQHHMANDIFGLILSMYEKYPRAAKEAGIEVAVSIREEARDRYGDLSDGYHDLAWVTAQGRSLCIPVPLLRETIGMWFYAHAKRREPVAHGRRQQIATEEEKNNLEAEIEKALVDVSSKYPQVRPKWVLR